MPKPPKIILGVTGSIAAYKAVELLRLMQRKGWDVWVVMTECATQYVGPLTFRALSLHPVPTGFYASMDPEGYTHLGLTEQAAVMVVAPCSANTMARLAHGLAEDVLSAAALSMDGPLLIAPAMNVKMWMNPATQENAATLARRGATIVPPGCGALACGATGAGRLAKLVDIIAAVENILPAG
ncbi:MAG: hypothetical protein LBN38_01345 [Verrucomicrobiota bacterium]|jgi:phosphopantothenoylcysteine decarboxylase/phosphopantothenate--cysteine ligase|nr:hypothetical protein [Verrucomicrobiota bacterium]